MNDKESKRWEDVQFMFDASFEVVEMNYEKAILVMRQGIEESLFEPNNEIDSKRLLHSLGLLITCLEESVKKNFGIEFNAVEKAERLENRCDFCAKSSSEVKTLVAGANGNICNSCVQEIFNKMKKQKD